jgi:hypothetical protein
MQKGHSVNSAAGVCQAKDSEGRRMDVAWIREAEKQMDVAALHGVGVGTVQEIKRLSRSGVAPRAG